MITGTHIFKSGLTLLFLPNIAITAREIIMNATPEILTRETFSFKNINAKNIDITADILRIATDNPLCPSFRARTSIACEAALTIPVTIVNSISILQFTCAAIPQEGSTIQAIADAARLLNAKNWNFEILSRARKLTVAEIVAKNNAVRKVHNNAVNINFLLLSRRKELR